jgi:hypothetical protein
MDQAMFLVVVVMIIAGLVLAIIVWRWTLDYRRPQWRQDRWVPIRTIHLWQSWFAWRPVRTLSNRVVWWTTVYRTVGNDYVDFDDWQWYHYADEFDLLRWA